jgi:TonB family protein
MAARSRVLLIPALSAAVFFLPGCASNQARDEVALGVQAYKNGDSQQAIQYFNYALQLDSGNTAARLALGNTYAHMWKPQADTADNRRLMQQAIDQYNKVLLADSTNITALRGAAYVYLHDQKLEFARHYLKRAIETEPKDPTAYYALAQTDWISAYKDVADLRSSVRLKTSIYEEQPESPPNLCPELRARVGRRVEEGLEMAQAALVKSADYQNAKLYMALLHRLKAAIECDALARQNENRLAVIFIERAQQKADQPVSVSQVVDDEVPTLAPWPPPPLPPEPPPARPKLTTVTGRLKDGAPAPADHSSGLVYLAPGAADNNLIRRVGPIYPPGAMNAHVEGDVILKVRINKDGIIDDMQVLAGHPMLVQSATDAVKQWTYRPYVLRGQPVEVQTTVRLKYHL